MDTFQNYRTHLIDTLNEIDTDILGKICFLMDRACSNGKQVFVLGNGGSAAAASHWVCDFGKGINSGDSARMKIFSLADNASIFSALGNDFSYEDTFAEQLKNYLTEGDLVISLSVSGNSPNLIKAQKYAKSRNAITVAIIGDYDGKISEFSDVLLVIKSKNYGVVEDIHIVIGHALSQYMKMTKAGEKAVDLLQSIKE
jgi:D-sedoheptulose 7-phosphate isomerase